MYTARSSKTIESSATMSKQTKFLRERDPATVREHLAKCRFWREDRDVAKTIFDGLASGSDMDRRFLYNFVSPDRGYYVGSDECRKLYRLLLDAIRPEELCNPGEKPGEYAQVPALGNNFSKPLPAESDRDNHYYYDVDATGGLLRFLGLTAKSEDEVSTTLEILEHYAVFGHHSVHRYSACHSALKTLRVDQDRQSTFAIEVLQHAGCVSKQNAAKQNHEDPLGVPEFVSLDNNALDNITRESSLSAPLLCAVWLAGTSSVHNAALIAQISQHILSLLDSILTSSSGNDVESLPVGFFAVFHDIVPMALVTRVMALAEAAVQRDEDPTQVGWKDAHIVHYHELVSAMGSVLDQIQKNLPDREQPAQLDKLASLVERFVTQTAMRSSMPWDRVRARSLEVLSWICQDRSAKVCFAALDDPNQDVMFFAAKAVQYISSVSDIVSNVVRICTQADPETAAVRLSSVLRTLDDREAVIYQLEELMLQAGLGSKQHNAAQALLMEMGGTSAIKRWQDASSRQSLGNQHREAMEKASREVYTLFENTMKDAKYGFRLALGMDAMLFFIGAALVLWSACAALMSNGTLDSWVGVGVGGGVGVLGVLYSLLIAKPRKQVKLAVDHMMITKIIFLGYLRELHQFDQTFVRWLMDDTTISDMQLRSLSGQLQASMSHTVSKMNDMLDMTHMDAPVSRKIGSAPASRPPALASVAVDHQLF